MHLNRNPDRFCRQETHVPLRRTRILATCYLASLAAIVFLTGAAHPGQQSPPSVTSDASQSSEMNDPAKPPEQPKQPTIATGTSERQKQISDDSAKLLALAVALKTEVDKTNKDMLSVTVIRKADEIEKLAHNVRDKMKATVGGS
jgi:hypothetical protein